MRGRRKSALLRDWLKESSANPAHWDAHQYERHVAVQYVPFLLFLSSELNSWAQARPPRLPDRRGPAGGADPARGRVTGRPCARGALPSPRGIRYARRLHTAVSPPRVGRGRALTLCRSSVPMDADVQETVPPRRARRVRYRANAVERGWTSTIDLEVGLPALEASITESAAHSAASAAADAKPVIRQTYRRSWHVMCPDG